MKQLLMKLVPMKENFVEAPLGNTNMHNCKKCPNLIFCSFIVLERSVRLKEKVRR